jgi:hypothetical protein
MDRASRFGEGAGSGFGCEVIGTVAAEPVTDSDTRAREGAEQRLSGKCGGRRRRLLHHQQSTALLAELKHRWS